MKQRHGLTLSLFAISVLALALRLWGVRFGFPYAYHFDEPTFVRAALNLGAGIIGSQPCTTGYPNILSSEYAVYFIVGRIVGLFESAAEVEQAWQAHPSPFSILFGRLTSAFLGTLTVLVVYRLGKETCTRVAGLLAALLSAVAFLHVRDSHYATSDITGTFLVSLSVLFSVLAVRQAKRGYLYVAGAAAGYAVVTKWTLLPIGIPMLVAALYTRSRQQGRMSISPMISNLSSNLLAILAPFLGGLLAGGFQLVLKPSFYLDYVRHEWQAGQAGGFWTWQVDTVPGWLFYLKTLNYGLGTLLLAMSLAGFLRRFVIAIRTRDWASLLLLSFPVPYSLLMGATGHLFARYALPLVPFCVVFAAESVVVVSQWLRTRRLGWGWWLVAILGVASIVQPLSSSIRHDILLTRQDTRTLAKNWIEVNIPSGAKIAVDWPVYGPPLSRDRYTVKEVGGVGLSGHPLEWYREKDIDHIVTSSYVYGLSLLDKDLEIRRDSFYASLDRELELVKEFSPGAVGVEPPIIFDEVYGPAISLWQRQRPGPVLKIYRVH